MKPFKPKDESDDKTLALCRPFEFPSFRVFANSLLLRRHREPGFHRSTPNGEDSEVQRRNSPSQHVK